MSIHCRILVLEQYERKNPWTGYKITKMCLSHNHNVNVTGINLDGCEEVQFLRDIHPKEVDTIEIMALGAHLGMSTMKETLSLHYPKRDFDYSIILEHYQ